MKRLGTALIAAVLGGLPLGASAQQLGDFPGLADSLAAIGGSAARQKRMTQSPILHGVM